MDGPVGPGVEQAVIRYALKIMLEDNLFWDKGSSGLAHPHLSPSDHPNLTRLHRFEAYGVLIALHCYYYGQSIVVNYFVLMAIATGRACMDSFLTLDFIRLIDPDVASELEPWFSLSPDDPLPTNYIDKVNQLLLHYLQAEARTNPF